MDHYNITETTIVSNSSHDRKIILIDGELICSGINDKIAYHNVETGTWIIKGGKTYGLVDDNITHMPTMGISDAGTNVSADKNNQADGKSNQGAGKKLNEIKGNCSLEGVNDYLVMNGLELGTWLIKDGKCFGLMNEKRVHEVPTMSIRDNQLEDDRMNNTLVGSFLKHFEQDISIDMLQQFIDSLSLDDKKDNNIKHEEENVEECQNDLKVEEQKKVIEKYETDISIVHSALKDERFKYIQLESKYKSVKSKMSEVEKDYNIMKNLVSSNDIEKCMEYKEKVEALKYLVKELEARNIKNAEEKKHNESVSLAKYSSLQNDFNITASKVEQLEVMVDVYQKHVSELTIYKEQFEEANITISTQCAIIENQKVDNEKMSEEVESLRLELEEQKSSFNEVTNELLLATSRLSEVEMSLVEAKECGEKKEISSQALEQEIAEFKLRYLDLSESYTKLSEESASLVIMLEEKREQMSELLSYKEKMEEYAVTFENQKVIIDKLKDANEQAMVEIAILKDTLSEQMVKNDELQDENLVLSSDLEDAKAKLGDIQNITVEEKEEMEKEMIKMKEDYLDLKNDYEKEVSKVASLEELVQNLQNELSDDSRKNAMENEIERLTAYSTNVEKSRDILISELNHTKMENSHLQQENTSNASVISLLKIKAKADKNKIDSLTESVTILKQALIDVRHKSNQIHLTPYYLARHLEVQDEKVVRAQDGNMNMERNDVEERAQNSSAYNDRDDFPSHRYNNIDGNRSDGVVEYKRSHPQNMSEISTNVSDDGSQEHIAYDSKSKKDHKNWNNSNADSQRTIYGVKLRRTVGGILD